MAKKKDDFISSLIALGVRPEVARAFSETNGLAPVKDQTLTSTNTDTDVRAKAASVTSGIPAPTPGSAASHKAPGIPAVQQQPGGGRSSDRLHLPSSATSNSQGQTMVQPFVNPLTGERNNPSLNWQQYLANWGFPPDVVNQLDALAKQYASDPAGFQAAALAYIRGTDWYKQTFPGIGAGESKGLFGDEAGYRKYVADATNAYQRFLGRAPSSQEIANYINMGYDPSQIGEHVQGVAYLKDPNNRFNIDYTLGAFDSQKVDKSQYGNLADAMFGLDNAKGDALLNRLQAAQQKFTRIFQGVAATPAVSLLNSGQLSEKDANNRPDVGF